MGPKASASVPWGQKVIEVAKQYQGVKYKWGGKAPKHGFAASGFTQYIFDHSATDKNCLEQLKSNLKKVKQSAKMSKKKATWSLLIKWERSFLCRNIP